MNVVTVGAAETGDDKSKGAGAVKLNVVNVAAADRGPGESGAEEEGARLNDVSTSIRSQGDEGMS